MTNRETAKNPRPARQGGLAGPASPAGAARPGRVLGIDLGRLREGMAAVSRIGLDPSTQGINRPGFSAADMEARRWLMGRMEGMGLATRMDGVGNVLGRWEVGDGPAVVVGSHLDSVPNGGQLDGTLGVMAGLECVTVLMEQGTEPRHPVVVLATSEEEGRFGGMLGSQALCGEVTEDWLAAAKDEGGTGLAEAMAAQGLDARDALNSRLDPDSVKAFLELHIEQGPVLDSLGIPVGIVEGISGVLVWRVTLEGRANHAGTTPMELRADAFAGLAEFAAAIPEMAREDGTPQSRLTIGKVSVRPNFPHTIPGEAVFHLVLRDLREDVILALAGNARRRLEKVAAKHGLRLDIEQASRLGSKRCHPDLVALLQGQARRLGIPAHPMPSGAGHDAQFLGEIAPAGLIFVPSIGGVSHAPGERTDWADIKKGCDLLLNCLAALAL